VLKTYLYNLKSAAKDGVVSTASGFKASFKSAVATACANFFIEPSETTEDELMAKLGSGLYITNISGLHSGTNMVSGDFSLKADGFYIEDGKVVMPVEQFTVAGGFYRLLENVAGVADNLFFDRPSSGGVFGSPSVWVKGLKVSGGMDG
jgi:PmbA protein